MPFTNFAIFDLGTPELLLILVIILLLFGSKKLPELSRSIGTSIRELKKEASEAGKLKDEAKDKLAETKASFTKKDDSKES